MSPAVRLCTVLMSLFLAPCILQAQLTEPVGTASPTQTATVVITATGTSGATTPIYVLTQGVQNSDFKLVSGGTCAASTSYPTLNATCTVKYTFTPSKAGTRYGGITLVTGTGSLLGNTYLTGIGTGPQVTYTPPAQSVLGSFISFSTVPQGVAVDGSGNIYIGGSTDQGHGVIYEVPSGCNSASCVKLLTIALYAPHHLAVDGSGNLFATDSGAGDFNGGVYEFVAVGGVVPVNATPVAVYQEHFFDPSGLAVDGAGNIYIGDGNNVRLEKVAAVNGIVPAGSSAVTLYTSSSISPIDGVGVDVAGNVYFNEIYSIKKISGIDGTLSTVVTGGLSSFYGGGGVAVDAAGNVWALDVSKGQTDEFLAVNGVVPVNPAVITYTNVLHPQDITTDGSRNVYVTDYSLRGVYKLDFSTPSVLTFPTATQDSATDTTDGAYNFQFNNSGNAALLAVSPGLSGLTTGNFSQIAGNGTPADCTSSFVLVPGAGCKVSIQFAPVAPASKAVSDTFSLTSNNLNATPSTTQSATLNGTAIPPLPVVTGISPAGGPSSGGTPVTITGSYLTSASAVNFGSVSATDLAVTNDTTISVLSPTGVGGSTVDVTVTTYGGTSVTGSADQFTYALTPDVITVPGTVPSSKAFNSGTVSIGATSTSGQPVIYTSVTSSVCSVSASGVVTFLSVGTCTVNTSQDAAGVYAAATTVPVNINVTAGANTITVTGTVPSSIAFNGGTASVAATSTSGQAVTYTSTTSSVCSVDTSGVVTFSSIGTCTVNLSQAAAGNFAAATTVTKNIQVTPAPNTITFPALSDTTYGGTAPVPAATSTSGKPVTYGSSTPSVCTSTSGGIITLIGAGTCTITANQSAAGNYAAASQMSRSFTVQPAGNVITIPGTVPASVVFASGTVSIGATSTSGQSVTYTSVTTDVCTVTTPGGVVTPLSIGLCTINVSQGAAGNYVAATTVPVNITVVAATNTITFPTLSNTTYNGTAPAPAATATSGQPVAYGSTTTAACTVTSSGTITLVATGICTITASQNAVGNYEAAVTVSQSFLITAGTLPVGTSSVTLTVPVVITTAGTLNTINVLTQGATGLDFNVVTPAVPPADACTTGTPYTVGQVCTVQYTFKPTQPFVRAGGVSLSDASGHLLGNSFLSGTGTGPHAAYSAAVPSVLGSGFTNTAAVAVDASGNVFVADSRATTVKEIVAVNGVVPASPTIRTLGSGFVNPGGIAVDGSGNVYVADSTNSAVKELIAVNGVVPESPAILTLGGNIGPTGIAVDAGGNVFVSDTTGNAVKEIPPGCLSASCVITLGVAQTPQGIAVDNAGNVYVADFSAAHVKKFVAVNGIVAPGSTSIALGSGFDLLYGLAVDGLGNVYLADTNHNAIKEVLAANGSVVTLATGYNLPQGIAVDVSGNVYEADSDGAAIHELSYTTAPSLSFATPTTNNTTDTTDGLKSFQIVNNGNAALTAIAPGIGGLSTGSFAVAAGSGTPADCTATFSLAVGASCSVSIAFTPAVGSNGAVTDAVTLIDNSLNATPSATQTVSLSGTAILPLPVVTGISPSTGSVLGGTVVTITGSSFLGASQVVFGSGSATSFTVVNDTTITATYQGGTTGAVDVTVVTTAGVSATSSADLFTSTIPSGFSAGSEPVGTPSSGQTAYITITKAGTLNTISVLTQGATGLDFKAGTAGTGACATSTAYNVGDVCEVRYTFTPTHPWLRSGGISLADASGNILGSTYLTGTGTGPQATYPSNSTTPIAIGGTSFNLIQGMAVDGNGTVYVSDPNNRLVEKIPAGCVTSSCVVTLVSGSYVEGIAVDGLGNLYIADIMNDKVKELVAVGGVVSASSAQLTLYSGVAPYGIAVDGVGNVFFTDISYGSVDELPLGGSFVRLATGFAQPYGVAVDQGGNIYVGNSGDGVVSKVPPGGGTPVPLHTFTNVSSLAIDGAGNVYVVNTNVPGISELIAVNGSLPANPATIQLAAGLGGPYSVAVDASGNVYTNSYTAPLVELAYGSAPAVKFATATPVTTTDTTDGIQSFQIVNNGNASLIGTAPDTGSLTTGNFTQVAGSGTPADCAASFTLTANTRCNVSLSFTPLSTASAAVTDTYIVTSNNLNAVNVSQTGTVTGTAIANKPAIQMISPASGLQSGNTPVGIFGTLMTGVTGVTFGGVPATLFQVLSDNIVFALSPPGTGTVDIQVTSPLGTSSITPGDQFTYVVASVYSAGSAAVGTQSQVLTASINITTAGTLQTISVLTQGIAGLDFKLSTPAVAPSDACVTGTAYTVGQSCTVQYTFTPTRPWTRAGGIALSDSAGVLLGNSSLSGTGTGPQAVFNKALAVSMGGGFASPNSVAVNAAGDVFVADTANNAVKKIPIGCKSASCTLTLGSGFSGPKGVAVDGSGNIFVADAGNSAVKEMIAVAGTIPANPVIIMLNNSLPFAASSVAVDQSGNLYVAFPAVSLVAEITPSGGVMSPNNAPIALGINFSSPQGVAVDGSGNVYVADAGTANAVYELVATDGVVPPSSTPVMLLHGFNRVAGVAVDGSGNVYATDAGTANAVYRIVAVDGAIPASPAVLTLGSGFSAPGGVAVDAAGNVFVASTGSNNVQTLPYSFAPVVRFATTTLAGTSDATDGPLGFQLTNNGNAALTAIAPGLSGFTTGSFAQTTGSGMPADCSSTFSLLPGASCNVSIAFAPASSANGAVSDTFTLTDNSLNATTATQTAVLVGTATPLPPVVTGISPTIGSTLGGTVVTITGTHFTGATSVHFGSIASPSFSVISDTSLTAPAPAGSAGAVDVTVASSGGMSASNAADQFTYSALVPSAGIWVVNADGKLTRLDLGGDVITSNIGPGNGSAAAYGGVAFDHSGQIWSVNSAANQLFTADKAGDTTSTYTGGGLNAPAALAVDGNGAVWIANGNGSVSEFSNGGTAVTPTDGYTGGSMSAPAGISIDIAGNVWVSNSGNNSVTEILGGAAPSPPLAVGTQNNTLGVRP